MLSAISASYSIFHRIHHLACYSRFMNCGASYGATRYGLGKAYPKAHGKFREQKRPDPNK